ncbi:MAG: hypothetical protein ACOY46_08050 [Bacillota bacterium]
MSEDANCRDRDHGGRNRNDFMLFATERAEDYVVLSLALVILIVILVFY